MSESTVKKSDLPKKVQKKKPWYRLGVQIFFFVLVLLISLSKFFQENQITIPFLSSASLHAICPFGGVVSIYKFATVGTFVQKVHESSFILMFISLILAIGFGPVICGWVCPLGSFQEWLSKIGRKIFGKKFNTFVPENIDKKLRYLRYFFLIMVLYQTAVTGKLMFQDIDPFYALFNLWSEEVAIQAYIILGVTILLSLFVERPWCKYICPYGAFLGIFNFFRIFKIRRAESTCISCKACDRACPMNISVSKSNAVTDHQCISCLKCTSENNCPIADTVEFSSKGGK